MTSITTSSRYIKTSSLTGGQAHVFVTKDDGRGYLELIRLSEMPCSCEQLHREKPKDKCRTHKVIDLWESYAKYIYPILTCKSIPPEILKAKETSAEALKEALENVGKRCQSWLSLYRTLFGPQTITPYVHIIGKHLPLMLEQCGYSIGEWSQQGFEACHKVIRRVFHHCTSLGGGTQRKSALLQIEEYLYRRSWALLRYNFTDNSDEGSSANPMRLALQQIAEKEYFEPIDISFAGQIDPEAIRCYVSRQSRMTSSKVMHAWKGEIIRRLNENYCRRKGVEIPIDEDRVQSLEEV